jgi:hypothetical protein
MENAILKNNGGITVLIITEKENIHAIKDTVRKVHYIQIHIPHYTMIHYCTFLACDGPGDFKSKEGVRIQIPSGICKFQQIVSKFHDN